MEIRVVKSGGVEGWLENGACPVPIPEGEEEEKTGGNFIWSRPAR